MAEAKIRTGNNLQIYLDKVKEELFCTNSLQQDKVDNISRAERQAIKNLSDNTNTVINKADKGSTIVVIDRQQYISDSEMYLNDVNTYNTEEIIHVCVTMLLAAFTCKRAHVNVQCTFAPFSSPVSTYF